MANSTSVPIVDDAWTLIASGASTGFFTNETGEPVLYLESNVLPGPNDFSVQHTLESDKGAFQGFDLNAGQNVYARLAPGSGDSAITVTLD